MRREGIPRVREAREALGLSQAELAERAGLTRQSVGAIEAGRATPSVHAALRLARALDADVESLFGAGRRGDALIAERAAPFAGRAAVAKIGDRWVAHPLGRDRVGASADGLASGEARGRLTVEPLSPPARLAENLLLLGCATALGVLADRLNGRRGAGRFVWLPRSSADALRELARGRAHVAGLHLIDARTGEANVPDVRRLRHPEPLSLITLATWEVGLVVRPDDPRAPRRAAELGRPGLRIAGRPDGAGAQRLLERTLRLAGLPRSLAARAAVTAEGHVDVARAVAMGAADVGVASRDVALEFGLGFVALASERYDLAVARSSLPDPRVQRLLDGLSSAAFRRELSVMGYDPGAAGARVAEVA